MINWATETSLIVAAAAIRSLDHCFIMAIRETENGGPGIEFGVEPPGAYDYHGQLEMTCVTVAHRLAVFPANPLTRDNNGRIIYSPNFIAYFASIWAPIGATNDPSGLNKNWLANCKAAYRRWVASSQP